MEKDQEENESDLMAFKMMMRSLGGSTYPTTAGSEGAESHQHAASKQRELGGVGVKADLVLAGSVRGEGEATFRTVLTRQDHLEGGG